MTIAQDCVRQKLGMILENKVVQKLKLEKNEVASFRLSDSSTVAAVLHCGKDNGESQYFVKINQILMVR